MLFLKLTLSPKKGLFICLFVFFLWSWIKVQFKFLFKWFLL